MIDSFLSPETDVFPTRSGAGSVFHTPRPLGVAAEVKQATVSQRPWQACWCPQELQPASKKFFFGC